ncbi:hypothetical protein NIES2100_12700 [Calothrix sp. NIES-2100]|nr:hypothetical protein NIES2100_12700 [Calothrix sp. NIES-2100]
MIFCKKYHSLPGYIFVDEEDKQYKIQNDEGDEGDKLQLTTDQ